MKSFPKAVLWAGALIFSITAYSAVPALAQQKTVKACEDEWKAHKADNQTKSITEKAFVEKCRATTSTEKPKAAPAAAKSDEKADKKVAAPAKIDQKTVKACEDEWKAHKADNQAKGVTEKAYVEECRAGTAAKMPVTTQTKTEAPKTAPTQAKMTPSAAPSTGKPSGENQFAAESAAKSHCRTGLVVWANLGTKVYHFSGNADYGHTKKGAYMCEKDATAQGFRAAKNEKHP